MTTAPDDDVEAIASALRADVEDLDVYARVVSTQLLDALPIGMVTVEKDRSLADRLSGRSGRVRSVTVRLDDWELSLTLGARGKVPVARMRQLVRGVAISSREVSLDDWVNHLARQLATNARASAEGRAALARLLGQS